MPTENNYTLTDGTLYIDGEKLGGIPDLELNIEAYEDFVEDEIRKNTVIGLNPLGELTCSIKMKLNSFIFYELTGLLDWVINNCPNRRVVHLIKYGKNYRVRIKNFKRGMIIIGKMLRK